MENDVLELLVVLSLLLVQQLFHSFCLLGLNCCDRLQVNLLLLGQYVGKVAHHANRLGR